MSSPASSLKPDDLLHQLSELWTTLGKADAHAPGAAGVLRACAMTLYVFVDEESDATAVGETLARLMRAHPSRAIVVRLRQKPGTLESRVFAQCWKPFGHSEQICCEQVEFTVSIDRMPDLPSIIAPLAAADLPRVIWFRAAALDRVANLAELLSLGDKLIFDTARAGAPAFADLRVLARAGYVIGDLSWTRLTWLRQLIAQMLAVHASDDLKSITIEHGGREVPPAARYLQAWLRSEIPTARVDAHATEEPADGHRPGPSIRAVRIGPGMSIHAGSNCADFEIAGIRQHANVPECSETDLLNEELGIIRHDPVFERALQRMTPWTPSP
jgi:glucose-6-phosphate dehydrogenase assembly protein OpcA